MNDQRDTGGRLMTAPFTQRCGRCGQEWWDSHACPVANAAMPVMPSPFVTVQVGLPVQAVAWQARKLKDGKDWGPPGTDRKTFEKLAAEGYEVRALVPAA